MRRTFEQRVKALDDAHRARTSRSRPFLSQWWDSLQRGTRPGMEAQVRNPTSEALRLTFVGHSTMHMRFGATEIVTDPLLGRWLLSLRRLRAAGLSPSELQNVSLILISHAHLDHLDRASLKQLPRHATVILPPRCSALISDLRFSKVVELGPGGTHRTEEVEVFAVAAKHWGRRMPFGRQRGFGGYVIRSLGDLPSVYFAGDTGYFDGFRHIGDKFQPDVSLLPIGSYDPPSFRRFHMSPLDAVVAFADLGSSTLVPLHFGSFTLSCEPIEEPAEWMRELIADRKLESQVQVLENGESLLIRP